MRGARGSRIRAVLVVSPTYYGYVSNIAGGEGAFASQQLH